MGCDKHEVLKLVHQSRSEAERWFQRRVLVSECPCVYESQKSREDAEFWHALDAEKLLRWLPG